MPPRAKVKTKLKPRPKPAQISGEVEEDNPLPLHSETSKAWLVEVYSPETGQIDLTVLGVFAADAPIDIVFNYYRIKYKGNKFRLRAVSGGEFRVRKTNVAYFSDNRALNEKKEIIYEARGTVT